MELKTGRKLKAGAKRLRNGEEGGCWKLITLNIQKCVPLHCGHDAEYRPDFGIRRPRGHITWYENFMNLWFIYKINNSILSLFNAAYIRSILSQISRKLRGARKKKKMRAGIRCQNKRTSEMKPAWQGHEWWEESSAPGARTGSSSSRKVQFVSHVLKHYSTWTLGIWQILEYTCHHIAAVSKNKAGVQASLVLSIK